MRQMQRPLPHHTQYTCRRHRGSKKVVTHSPPPFPPPPPPASHLQLAQGQQQGCEQQKASLLLIQLQPQGGGQLVGSFHAAPAGADIVGLALQGLVLREGEDGLEEGEALQQTYCLHGGRAVQHALQLSAHALPADLLGQGGAHLSGRPVREEGKGGRKEWDK